MKGSSTVPKKFNVHCTILLLARVGSLELVERVDSPGSRGGIPKPAAEKASTARNNAVEFWSILFYFFKLLEFTVRAFLNQISGGSTSSTGS